MERTKGLKPGRGGVQTRGGVRTRGGRGSHGRKDNARPLVSEPTQIEVAMNPVSPKKKRILSNPMLECSETCSRAEEAGSPSLLSFVDVGVGYDNAPSPIALQQHNEIAEILFLGSEEESEDDKDEYMVSGTQEEGLPQMVIPRHLRRLFNDPMDTPAEVVIPWQSSSPPAGSDVGDLSPPHELTETLPTFLPTSKFDFVWREFPQPQIDPELRKEPFADIKCGPTTPYARPYDAFTAIWDKQIMEHIVLETNRYAQQKTTFMLNTGTMRPNSRITKWYDTSVNEMYVFLAILQAMGIVVKTRLEEYWNETQDIFATPGFTCAMTYDRFMLLSKCLHFHNIELSDPSFTSSQAKRFKLEPIISHLNKKFSELYILDRNIALDESLTMWKSSLNIRQHIPNKAATVGIKTYELCESKTGYLWRFEVHTGNDEPLDTQVERPVSGCIPALVFRLLKGLEHRGHTVWMDNYYNSPALARELKCRGFDCVGTLRMNRQFVPVELARLDKTNMVVGQVRGLTSGDVDIVVWRDKNRVALISTYHGLATAKTRDGTLKPNIVLDYNICMGGVDHKDQMISMFPIERKRTAIWYKKLFRRLLNVSVLNAYILCNSQGMSHRSFRKILVQQLLEGHPTKQPLYPYNRVRGFIHVPQKYNVSESNRNRLRSTCVECGKRVTTFCKGCDKPLCAFICFGPYHTKLFKDIDSDPLEDCK